MILYFSATGNSKYVAEKIATSIDDEAHSIEKFKKTITLEKGEILGIVFPTYCWELPIIVRNYLERLTIAGTKNPYVFVLATFGTTPGAALDDCKHILKDRGILVSAKYGIQMPDTWTPIFDLSDSKEVKKQNERADEALCKVIQKIQKRESGNFMKKAAPYPIRYLSDFMYQAIRKTRHFSVEDSCIGCGLCEKRCPAKAIQIQDKKPVWIKNKCVMCLRCLHNCPKFSIQYGKNTKKHGQYHHPNV